MAYEIVVVGASRGGFDALQTVLQHLKPDFRLPIAVVQHRPAHDGKALMRLLQVRTRLSVVEPDDKQLVLGGHVYLAPSNYHLLLETGRFSLSVEPPVRHARPAIDVLFESAADAYGDRAVGIVLSGSNADGAAGLARIHARGGLTLVQRPDSAERPEMPKAAKAAVQAARVLSLRKIAECLSGLAVSPEYDDGAGVYARRVSQHPDGG